MCGYHWVKKFNAGLCCNVFQQCPQYTVPYIADIVDITEIHWSLVNNVHCI